MIDLHVHSNASDGILSPLQIVKLAKNKGLQAISITDHDTITGSKQVINTKIIELVPGIEISTDYQEQEMHILGYYIDLDDKELLDSISWLRTMRRERAIKMIDKLTGMGAKINREKMLSRKVIGRPHFAKILVEQGLADDYKDAFNRFLTPGGKIFVKRKKLGYKKTVDLIINSGGIPILAHPGDIHTNNVIPWLDHAISKGVKGIEILHPSNNEKIRNILFNYCEEHDLLISGGSDFHGSGNRLEIGVDNIPYSYLEKIKQSL